MSLPFILRSPFTLTSLLMEREGWKHPLLLTPLLWLFRLYCVWLGSHLVMRSCGFGPFPGWCLPWSSLHLAYNFLKLRSCREKRLFFFKKNAWWEWAGRRWMDWLLLCGRRKEGLFIPVLFFFSRELLLFMVCVCVVGGRHSILYGSLRFSFVLPPCPPPLECYGASLCPHTLHQLLLCLIAPWLSLHCSSSPHMFEVWRLFLDFPWGKVLVSIPA